MGNKGCYVIKIYQNIETNFRNNKQEGQNGPGVTHLSLPDCVV